MSIFIDWRLALVLIALLCLTTRPTSSTPAPDADAVTLDKWRAYLDRKRETESDPEATERAG